MVYKQVRVWRVLPKLSCSVVLGQNHPVVKGLGFRIMCGSNPTCAACMTIVTSRNKACKVPGT